MTDKGKVTTPARENLLQLRELSLKIHPSAYSSPLDILSGASIGQHIRHVLEFYQLLVSGSISGNVCYDKRERDPRIELDPEAAIQVIDRLLPGLDTLDVQYPVRLSSDYSATGGTSVSMDSSVGRELAYCVEHSIHHQALIKAGLISLDQEQLIDQDFGVAYSTIRYRDAR